MSLNTLLYIYTDYSLPFFYISVLYLVSDCKDTVFSRHANTAEKCIFIFLIFLIFQFIYIPIILCTFAKIKSTMTENEFKDCIRKNATTIEQIRLLAHQVHNSVNQTYDKTHPYGFHLDMVADATMKYGATVCQSDDDLLPLIFGAFFHDSIEDARLSYNDVKRAALRFMNESQATIAAEIVYALTNDKGRTRAERAGEKYFKGIRTTPYAPLVKLADRLANITYSYNYTNKDNYRMKQVYADEMPLFLEAITVKSDDPRLGLPEDMIKEIKSFV